MTKISSTTSVRTQQPSREKRGGESGLPFAEATHAARKGRYSEALELLDRAMESGDCSEEKAWDLKARIYAQQGVFLSAESCWMNALRLNGSNTAYADALAHLRRTRSPIWHSRGIAGILLSVAILSVLVWQIAIVKRSVRQSREATAHGLVAIQREMLTIREADHTRDVALRERMRATDLSLVQIRAILSDRLGPASRHNSIVHELDKRLTENERSFSRQLTQLENRSMDSPKRTRTSTTTVPESLSGSKGRSRGLTVVRPKAHDKR